MDLTTTNPFTNSHEYHQPFVRISGKIRGRYILRPLGL